MVRATVAASLVGVSLGKEASRYLSITTAECPEGVAIEVDPLPSGLEFTASSIAIEFPNVQKAIAFIRIEIESGPVSFGTLLPQYTILSIQTASTLANRFHIARVDVALQELPPVIADLLDEITCFEHGVVREVGLRSRV